MHIIQDLYLLLWLLVITQILKKYLKIINFSKTKKLNFDVDNVNKYVKEKIKKATEKNFFCIKDKELSLGGAG